MGLEKIHVVLCTSTAIMVNYNDIKISCQITSIKHTLLHYP